MKQLNTYITEYIINKKLDKPIDSEDHYDYYPETKDELINIIKTLLDKGETNLNCINTSKITDMCRLFSDIRESGYNISNIEISMWNMSNVENFSTMFFNCKDFNCDISEWDVSSMKRSSNMFWGCINFNCDLSKWNVSNLQVSDNMFFNCENLDCDLSNWNTKNLRRADQMFQGCRNMTCDISNWNVNGLYKYSVRDMFKYCKRKFIPDWYRKIK